MEPLCFFWHIRLMPQKARAMLIILDGFGNAQPSSHNAIANARMPFYQGLLKKYPHGELLTHGKAVGLPDGVMGNSEVGHMTLGSGRVIYQDLVRVNHAIESKEFFRNPTLLQAFQKGSSPHQRVHLIGLVSNGGVHSHIDHLKALLDLGLEQETPSVVVHAILDGRDTPPDSSPQFIEELIQHPAFQKNALLGSLSGRYWAMDRDKRWERTEKALNTYLGKDGVHTHDPLDLIQNSHAQGKMDEFLEPVLLSEKAKLQPGDAVIFFNYRADRARQLTEKICAEAKPSVFVCMTEYDSNFGLPLAFPPQELNHVLGEVVSSQSLSQFRIAETEKYAHVTFFFNGGREKPFSQEDRLLIPSPKEVATYDLKPEMSAFTVAEEAARRVKQYDFMLMNFANADMVGHTGIYEAAIRAMEALDQCLEKVVGAAEKNGMHVLITADHGNAEEMLDCNHKPHTQHTLNPVPILWIEPGSAIAPQAQRKSLGDGTLADVMPTLVELMGLPSPTEMTGKSLLPGKQSRKSSSKNSPKSKKGDSDV